MNNYFLQLKKDIPNDIGWIRRILSYAFDWYIGGMIASLPVIVIYMMLHQDATYIPQNLSIFHAPYNIIAGSLSFIVASGYYVLVPMFIVENGFGAIDQKEVDGSVHDQYRIDYLKEHIQEMKKAVDIDGVDLLGYTVWGCIDCVSFSTGEMKKRYGFIYVDRDNEGNGTLERSKKDSYDWYKKVIASNGEEL